MTSDLMSNNSLPLDVLLLCGIPNHMHDVDLSVPAAMLATLVSLANLAPSYLAIPFLDACLVFNAGLQELCRACT